jgi:hypothetical protein
MLLALGHWGQRRAGDWIPAALGATERDHPQRVVTRGARTCQVVGVVFLVMIVPVWL